MTQNPLNVQELALARAVNLLKASKVKYAIQLADGTILGELPVRPVKDKKPPKYRKVYRFVKMFPGYIEQVGAMKPGDVLRWTCENVDVAKAFIASVSATCVHKHGKGACITTASGDPRVVVEALRVE